MILVTVRRLGSPDDEDSEFLDSDLVQIPRVEAFPFESLADARSWVHHVAWGPGVKIEIYNAMLITEGTSDDHRSL